MVNYICLGLGVILAYYSYTVVELLQITKQVTLHHNEGCARIETPLPSEDIIVFGDWVIGATGDGIPMYYAHLGAEQARPGFLMAINPKTKAVSQIDVKGMPNDYQLNAHGLTLFKNDLYVLSHSYSKGGERVFVFELSASETEVTAAYKASYSFGEEHGNYNGIAVITEKQFFVTQWIPFPDTPTGRDNSFFTGLNRMARSIYTRSNPVRFCSVNPDDSINCVDKAYGYIPNGILYSDNKLWFADSIERTVSVFNITKDFGLKLLQKVKITHTLDNLCAVGKDVYVTGISKMLDYLLFGESVKNKDTKLHHVPGGYSRIFVNEKGYYVAEEVLMQDLISLPSSVAITGDIVTITSIIDSALVFCKNPRSV